jgi:hypothetical protein
MTEKRFKETISTGTVTDTVTGKEYKCEMRIDDDLLKLMNDLDEENTQLKKILNISKNDNVNDILDVLNLQQTRIWELNRENEQLKNNLSEIEKIINKIE